MKKIVLFLALLTGTVGAANAQGARFGLKAGASLANFVGKNTDNSKNLVGFVGGLMADFGFSDLISFHPELLYSQKGAKGESSGTSGQTRTSYLDVPLLLRVNADGPFFEAGPQVGFLLAQKSEYDVAGVGSGSSTSTDGTRKIDVGYIVGLGYRAPQGLEIGLRYNGGISDIRDPSGSDKIRNSVFQLQLGYLFGGQ